MHLTKTHRIVYTGIFAVLLAICSWISIPTLIPFTLQTFGIFFTLFILGGRQGTITILIYLLLGCIGIPVFSNFGAGLGCLLGNSGGYAIGFVFIGLTCYLYEKLPVKNIYLQLMAMVVGLFLCYAFGTFWFMNISMSTTSSQGLLTVLTMCVFPFIIPDFCKLALAYFISKRIKHMLY